MTRHRHPKKDIEVFLKVLEKSGWTVDKKKKYFRVRCPCGAHARSVHLTPSSSNYLTNLKKWVDRTCPPSA